MPHYGRHHATLFYKKLFKFSNSFPNGAQSYRNFPFEISLKFQQVLKFAEN